MIEKISPLVKKSARKVAYNWPGVVSAEDLEQDVWLFIAGNKKLQEFLKTTDDEKMLQRVITRKCHSLASKTRADYDKFRGVWAYNVAECKMITQQLVRGKDPGFDHRVDFQQAFQQLTPKEQERIEEWGRMENDTTPRGRKATSRAFTKLVTYMNTSRSARAAARVEGPGTKHQKGNPA